MTLSLSVLFFLFFLVLKSIKSQVYFLQAKCRMWQRYGGCHCLAAARRVAKSRSSSTSPSLDLSAASNRSTRTKSRRRPRPSYGWGGRRTARRCSMTWVRSQARLSALAAAVCRETPSSRRRRRTWSSSAPCCQLSSWSSCSSSAPSSSTWEAETNFRLNPDPLSSSSCTPTGRQRAPLPRPPSCRSCTNSNNSNNSNNSSNSFSSMSHIHRCRTLTTAWVTNFKLLWRFFIIIDVTGFEEGLPTIFNAQSSTLRPLYSLPVVKYRLVALLWGWFLTIAN